MKTYDFCAANFPTIPTIPTIPTTLKRPAEEQLSSQIKRRPDWIKKVSANAWANEVKNIRKLPVEERAIRPIHHNASDEYIRCVGDSVNELFAEHKDENPKSRVCAEALINLIRASNDNRFNQTMQDYLYETASELAYQGAFSNLSLADCDLSNMNFISLDLVGANFAGVDLSQNTVMENVDISNSIFNNDTIFSPNQKFTLKLDDIASDDSHLMVYFEYPKTVNTCLFSTIEKINHKYWLMKLDLMHQVIAEASKSNLVCVSAFIIRFFADHLKYLTDERISEFFFARLKDLQNLGGKQLEQLSDSQ